LRLKGISLHVAGVLGTKGSAGEVDAKVACETEMEVEGKIPSKWPHQPGFVRRRDLVE